MVTLTFSPYDIAPMTRAATSIVTLVDHLDVWIYESGTEAVAIHRNKAEHGIDFCTVQATLDKTKTYTLYAVAHKSGAATLADGIITWPDDQVTHSMYYTETFTPSTTTTLDCLMQRIVARFNFETTDAVPDDVTQMRFTFTDVHDRWSIITGATHQVNSTVTTSVTPKADGTCSIYLYTIVTDEETLHTVTVEALDASDNVRQTRTFDDVPLRNGYQTKYMGTYFTDTPTAAAFTVDAWNNYDTVMF